MTNLTPQQKDNRLRPGTNHCKCPACGEYFTTPGNFDLHRSGKGLQRVCIDPKTIVYKKGKHEGIARLRPNTQGLWTSTRVYGG